MGFALSAIPEPGNLTLVDAAVSLASGVAGERKAV